MTARRAVAVIGPADADVELLADAETIGAGLARAGVVVVTGGLGGVMAAAARGASSAGGLVVGVLPGDDATAANEWVDVAVPTGLGQLRNAVVVRAAEVVISVGGSWGTLAEIAHARRAGRAVVSLHGWRVDGPPAGDEPLVAAGPDAAVEAALALLGVS